MNKKETSNQKDLKNQNYEAKKNNTTLKTKNMKDKNLPWWVELLFVQIGLPDKFLIQILKFKKNSREFIKKDNKLILTFLLIFTTFAYFYPVIRYSKNKLDCEAIAKNYFIKNKSTNLLNKKESKMLSTNFCNGGSEINTIENSKN